MSALPFSFLHEYGMHLVTNSIQDAQCGRNTAEKASWLYKADQGQLSRGRIFF